jgi:hypothetical protein
MGMWGPYRSPAATDMVPGNRFRYGVIWNAVGRGQWPTPASGRMLTMSGRPAQSKAGATFFRLGRAERVIQECRTVSLGME